MAHEQLGVQYLLKMADPLRDGGLSQKEFFGGFGEGPSTNDASECMQMFKR
jgi:hypothetical protein